MGKLLEALIAKGRRARRPRDHREVAFGLAELSTTARQKEVTNIESVKGDDNDDDDILLKIFEKGGIKTLVLLLSSTPDIEAQRFSALAIANVSSAARCRVKIGQDGATAMELISYLKRENDEQGSQCADYLGKQYCAIAIGNLSSDPANHLCIVELGGVSALVTLLKSSEADIDCCKFAAFALANIASNSCHRGDIVQEGAITPLVSLACCDEIDAQRKALAALRSICIDPNYRIEVVRLGIIDPLILITRSASDRRDIYLLREVAGAFNCLSCMEENKDEICDRAISSVLSLLLANDVEVERHASSAIASLLEVSDIHERFFSEKGIAPLMALSKSEDLICKGEAIRGLSNLAANIKFQGVLIQEGILDCMTDALKKEEINCKRFAALCLANLSTTVLSQEQIMAKCDTISLVIALAKSASSQIEARRYAVLVLANLSATIANHQIILDNDGLGAIFSSANFTPDVMSQYYVGCALSNLSSNPTNHELILKNGGIQPLISLLYCQDVDVQSKACAAMRGLSVSAQARIKIVQEGALEPLRSLLASEDVETLREVTAAFCNLTQSDENKYEVSKCGSILPLIQLMQSDDMFIASQSSAALANISEIAEHQAIIGIEAGGIRPCVSVMRSRFVEVQRESGRLLANLAASNEELVSDRIVQTGGHQLFLSLLLSDDTACQRVGAFGIGNLCTHEPHREEIVKSGALEPLCSLARSSTIPIQIRRFAMLALANLSTCVATHRSFVDEDAIPLLIALSSSSDTEVRQYAAYCISKLGADEELRQVVTKEGGLEAVLYLSRAEQLLVRVDTLPAIANLSFSPENNPLICKHGGLACISAALCNHAFLSSDDGMEILRCAMCSIANIGENIDNIGDLVKADMIVTLIDTLSRMFPLSDDQAFTFREGLRALTNIATISKYAEEIVKNSRIIQILCDSWSQGGKDCACMAAMCIANLSAAASTHDALLIEEADKRECILSVLVKCCISGIPNSEHDSSEIVRYALLAIANFSCNQSSHAYILQSFGHQIHKYINHRDIKCRHFIIFIVGNLCSNPDNLTFFFQNIFIKAVLDHGFPSTSSDTNAHFQAILAIRGMGTSRNYRRKLLDHGVLEPLILSCANNSVDGSTKLEAIASICNLSLEDENKKFLARSGVIATLINVLKGGCLKTSLTKTPELRFSCQTLAMAALANLAEIDDSFITLRIINEGCLKEVYGLAKHSISCQLHEEISRFIALMSCKENIHKDLLSAPLGILKTLQILLGEQESNLCQAFAGITIGNFANYCHNHVDLFRSDVIKHLLPLSSSQDETSRHAVAFCLHNLVRTANSNEKYIEALSPSLIKSLCEIINVNENSNEAMIMTLIAIRFLTKVCSDNSKSLVWNDDFTALIKFANEEYDVELKIEVAAALRNFSQTSRQSKCAMAKNCDVLTAVYRLGRLKGIHNQQIVHQSCAVLANLAEERENHGLLFQSGILQHLKFVFSEGHLECRQECHRAFANLSSNEVFALDIVQGGVLIPIVEAISNEDDKSIQYSLITLRNLTSLIDVQQIVMSENILEPIIKLLNISTDTNVQKVACSATLNAVTVLTNISASEKWHHLFLSQPNLINSMLALTDQSCEVHDDLALSATNFIANLAANENCHDILSKSSCLEIVCSNLKCGKKLNKHETFDLLPIHINIIRGLSASKATRLKILAMDFLDRLLDIAMDQGAVTIRNDILATLCNLSLSGCIGDEPLRFLQKINIEKFTMLLCSDEISHSLFGAVSLGNIASKEALHSTIIENGVLDTLVSNSCTQNYWEIKRCIAFALVNIAVNEVNCKLILEKSGLESVIFLLKSKSTYDCIVSLKCIRSLCGHGVFAASVAKSTLIEAILNNIKVITSDQECRLLASSCVYILTTYEECRQIFYKNESRRTYILQLIDCMISCENNDGLLAYCIGTLSNLSENREWHQDINEYWNHVALLKLIQNSNVLVRREATRMLSNISMNVLPPREYTILQKCYEACQRDEDEIVKIFGLILMLNGSLVDIRPNEDIFSLFNFFRCSDLYRRAACQLLCSICSVECYHNAFLQSNGLQFLRESLRNNDVEIRTYACFALSKVACFESFHTQVLGCTPLTFLSSLIDILSPLLCMPSSAIVYALSVIRKLCRQPIVRRQILSCQYCLKYFSDVISKHGDSFEILREISSNLCYISLEDRNKRLIVHDEETYENLFVLCHKNDEKVTSFTVATFANMAEDIECHSVLLDDSTQQVLDIALMHMRGGVLSTSREAVRLLSNMLSSSCCHRAFFLKRGLGILSRLSLKAMTSDDHESLHHAATCYLKLSSTELNHEELLFPKSFCIKNLCQFVESTAPKIQITSASALENISKNVVYDDQCDGNGSMLITCCKLLCTCKNPTLNMIGTNILLCLSSLSINWKRGLLEANVYDIIVSHTSKSENSTVIDNSSGILANLCEIEKFQSTLIENGLIATLLEFASKGSSQSRCNVSRACCLLSTNRTNCQKSSSIFREQEIRMILSFFSSNIACVQFSLMTICNILVYRASCEIISNTSLINSLVDLLKKYQGKEKYCTQLNLIALHRIVHGAPFLRPEMISISNKLLSTIFVALHAGLEEDESLSLMLIGNLLAIDSVHEEFLKLNGIAHIRSSLEHCNEKTRELALSALTNLTASSLSSIFVLKSGLLPSILNTVKGTSKSCKTASLMVLANLMSSSTQGCQEILESSPAMLIFSQLISAESSMMLDVSMNRMILLCVYNASKCYDFHTKMIDLRIHRYCIELAKTNSTDCKRLAIMTLSNFAATSMARAEVTRGKGLQTGLMMMADEDVETQVYASNFIANITNSDNAQRQFVVHGGFRRTMTLMSSNNTSLQIFAATIIANISENTDNHKVIIQENGIKALLSRLHSNVVKDTICISIMNVSNSIYMTPSYFQKGFVSCMIHQMESFNSQIQCHALSSLRSFASRSWCAPYLFEEGVSVAIKVYKLPKHVELMRELGGLLSNLSIICPNKLSFFNDCLGKMKLLLTNQDHDVLRQTLSALATLTENLSCHLYISEEGLLDLVAAHISQDNLDIKREIARFASNMATSVESHNILIQRVLPRLSILTSTDDEDLIYYLSLALRKLSINKLSHAIIIHESLDDILNHLSRNNPIRMHFLNVICDIVSMSNTNTSRCILEKGVVRAMMNILRRKDNPEKVLATTILRHMSYNQDSKEEIIDSSIVHLFSRQITTFVEVLRTQIVGIISNISESIQYHMSLIRQGVMTIISTLHNNSNTEIRFNCARSLSNLCANEEVQPFVIKQGGLISLISLSKEEIEHCQRYTASALRSLALNTNFCNQFSDIEVMRTMLYFAVHDFEGYKEVAAISFASMSLCDNARRTLASNESLIHALRDLIANENSLSIQNNVAYTLINIVLEYESHQKLLDFGVLDILLNIAERNSNIVFQRYVMKILAFMSANEKIKSLLSKCCLTLLFKAASSNDDLIRRLSSLIYCNLCQSSEAVEMFDHIAQKTLCRFFRSPDMDTGRSSALAFASLSLGRHGQNKEILSEKESIRPILNLLKIPDVDMKKYALVALNAFALGAMPQSKLSIEENGGLKILFEVLDQVDDSEAIHTAVYLIGSLSENEEVKDELIALGAISKVINCLKNSSIEIKRAASYYFAILSKDKELLSHFEIEDLFRQIIDIASLSDKECQDYGAYILANLANIKEYQRLLVQMGAVKPLVFMMKTDAESKHYAGLALLKLADNYENHLSIAEEGGIQALLDMGRNREIDEDLSYKTSTAIGNLASKAVKSIPLT